ncbi:MAG: hypothetical protein NVS1B9_07610 [Solirubrobacteraceae bacterium]
MADQLRRLRGKPLTYVSRRILAEGRRYGYRVLLSQAVRGRGPLRKDRFPPGGPRDTSAATAVNALGILPWATGLRAIIDDDELCSRAIRRAEGVMSGKRELFGDTVRVSESGELNRDVLSGHDWPLGFHARLDYRNIGRASDVKVPWELSRLRHVVALTLGAAAVAQPAPMLTRAAHEVEHWDAANPTGWSVNWSCGMEVALRAVNLICADAITLAAEQELPARERLQGLLYRHGWFLSRHLEISDLNGNHYLANGVGLIWLGRYFAGLGEADRWLARGREMVIDAARSQILADGVDHEGSLPYHVLVLEMFLVARAADPTLAPVLDAQLGEMLTAASVLSEPRGRIANLGDDDGGRVLAFADLPPEDARRVIAAGAALLDLPRLWRNDAPLEDALLLAGPAAVQSVADRAAPDAAQLPAHLAAAGLIVLGGGGDHIVVDAGPVGFRGRGGHGHLDAMSVTAILGGAVAVRDSGTGSYTGDPPLRQELRDAAAHNVVLVDELRYAELGGVDRLWAIDGDAAPELVALDREPDRQRAHLRQLLPARSGTATFERRIEWRPGCLAWEDTIAAPRGSAITAFLQLPDEAELDGDGGLRAGPLAYRLSLPDGAALELVACRRSERYGTSCAGIRAQVSAVASGAPVRLAWEITRR